MAPAEATSTIAAWGHRDRIALQLLCAGGLVYALLVVLLGAGSIVIDLVTGDRVLTLYITERLQPNVDASATLVHGTLDSATVFVSGLSPATSALLTIGSVVAIVAHLLVAMAFVYLCWRLLRREPFLRSLTRSFVYAGGILSLGSVVAQVLTGIGNNLAISELGIDNPYNRFWPLPAQIDVWPLAVALILSIVAVAMQYAEKLTVETRGLV